VRQVIDLVLQLLDVAGHGVNDVCRQEASNANNQIEELLVVHYQGIPVAVVGFFCAAICAANEASTVSSPSLSFTHSIT